MKRTLLGATTTLEDIGKNDGNKKPVGEDTPTQDIGTVDKISGCHPQPLVVGPKTLLESATVDQEMTMVVDQQHRHRVNERVVIVSAGLEHQKQLFELVYKNVFEQPSCIGKVSGFFTKRNYGTILLFTLFMIKFFYPEVTVFFLGVAAPLVAFLCALLFKLFYLHIVMADLHDIALSYIKPDRKNLWVALDERSNEVVGSIAITFHSSFPQRAQLKRMFVTPNYRGQNIAKSLLDVACSFSISQGFTSLFLITTSDHRAAMSLYYKTGFTHFKQWPLWSFRGWFKVSNVYLIKNLKTSMLMTSGQEGQQAQFEGHKGQGCAEGSKGDLMMGGDKPREVKQVFNHKCNDSESLHKQSAHHRLELDAHEKHSQSFDDIYLKHCRSRQSVTKL